MIENTASNRIYLEDDQGIRYETHPKLFEVLVEIAFNNRVSLETAMKTALLNESFLVDLESRGTALLVHAPNEPIRYLERVNLDL